MKLISLYIENFGGLSRFALDFEAGLTVINQPNGFGKTTLAEFIRAMLYGFPRRTKTLGKSRRQRYAPWSGGQYSGNLVFEHEGQRYRIERTFGAAPKSDTFTLIELATNRRSGRFSEEIGIELFGLDSDSFERSTYLPQMREEGTLSTAAIQAKLSNLVEDSSDLANFDKAIASLKAKRSSLIPYRGSGGTVAEAGAMIAQLQMQLDEALLQKTQLEEAQKLAAHTQAQIKAEQTALEQVRQELAEAAEMAAMVTHQRQYRQLQAQHQQASLRTKQIQEAYPAGFPDDDALNCAEAMADRWTMLTAQSGQRNNQQFPSQQQIDTCRKTCADFDMLQLRIHTQQAVAAELTQTAKERFDTDRTAQTGIIIAWAVCGLSLLAGSLLLVLQESIYGCTGLGIGILAAIFAVALTISRQNQRRARKNELEGKHREIQREITSLCERRDQCRRQIIQFLLPYYGKIEPQQFLASLTQLEHDAKMAAQARQWNMEAATCRTELEDFFSRFDLVMEQDVRAQLRHLREDIRNIQAAQTSERLLLQQIAVMEDACGDTLFAELRATADPRQLKAQEERLRNGLTEQEDRLLQIRQRVQTLRTQVEQIGELQETLERWQKRQAKDRERVQILDDTMDFLQRARENLSTSYLGTIQSRFGHYLSRLEGNAGEAYFIDTDFQVQLERMGCARDLAYFSAGQTDLVMLCMRLALVDALFKGQETFVILDDPFVNLDDAHTAQAQKLLRALGRERQILYLTCHSSRTLTSK